MTKHDAQMIIDLLLIGGTESSRGFILISFLQLYPEYIEMVEIEWKKYHATSLYHPNHLPPPADYLTWNGLRMLPNLVANIVRGEKGYFIRRNYSRVYFRPDSNPQAGAWMDVTPDMILPEGIMKY